jgi:hypothetical protein
VVRIESLRILLRPRDGSGQTRLGSGWAGLLGGLGHENCRALARRSGLARSAQPAQKPVGLTRPAKTPNFAPKTAVLGAKRVVLEVDYDNNRNKPTLSALRIAHGLNPTQPGPSRGLSRAFLILVIITLMRESLLTDVT